MKKILAVIVLLATEMTFAQQPAGAVSHSGSGYCKQKTEGILRTAGSALHSAGGSAPNVAMDSNGQTNPMLKIGKRYLGTTYVAHTLDRNTEEKLVVQRDSVDCLTFVEYVTAEAMGPCFDENLQKIRYRDGIIDGYPSRLHYTSDWIDNGVRHGLIKDITAEHSPYTIELSISYMSAYPQKYKQLADSPANVARMAAYEKALSGKSVHWLPKNKLPDQGLPWIMNGDIIAFTTSVKGLDIAHVGIAQYIRGKLHLLHASSTQKKVVTSEKPVSKMFEDNKSWTGIRVVRVPQPSKSSL